MPMPRLCTGTPSMRWPSMRISPASGTTKPAIARRSVVLPLPLGPSRPKNSPSGTASVTSSSAATAP